MRRHVLSESPAVEGDKSSFPINSATSFALIPIHEQQSLASEPINEMLSLQTKMFCA